MLVWNRSDVLSLKARDQFLERTCTTRPPMAARISLNRDTSTTEENVHVGPPGSVVKMAERACPPLQTSNHIAEFPLMHDSAMAQSINTGHASEGIHLDSNRCPSPEMLYIRSQGIHTYNVWLLGHLCWTFGPSILQSQQVHRNENKSQARYSGMGLKLTARPLKFFTQAVMFQLAYLRHLGSYSLHCSIAFANMVPKNSRVMDIVRMGDPQSLEKLFETGNASYRDTAPDGTSLLHVSPSLLDRVLTLPAKIFRLLRVGVA